VTTLSLAQVCDLDCIASFAPLVLDQPCPVRYARGPAAILRRVIYWWCDPVQMAVALPDLKAARVDGPYLIRLRADLERAADLDYVAGLSAPLLFDGTTLQIFGRVQLIDGQTYALEVSMLDGPPAILAASAALLGGSS
jgi:hypothetical protein